MQRYYDSESVAGFLARSTEYMLGCMDQVNEFDLTMEQRGAWLEEFDIQGLELDWTCLAWDGDFRYDSIHHSGQHFNFRSDRWQNINIAEGRAYQLNAYRVLLTRARQGIVICVPEGNPDDATRLPEFYDGTYELFRKWGLREI